MSHVVFLQHKSWETGILSGVAVMSLTQILRDWGSMPLSGTIFCCPLEQTFTFNFSQNLIGTSNQ